MTSPGLRTRCMDGLDDQSRISCLLVATKERFVPSDSSPTAMMSSGSITKISVCLWGTSTDSLSCCFFSFCISEKFHRLLSPSGGPACACTGSALLPSADARSPFRPTQGVYMLLETC